MPGVLSYDKFGFKVEMSGGGDSRFRRAARDRTETRLLLVDI